MQPKLICCEERLQGADLPPPLLCEASEQNDSEKGMREKEGRGGRELLHHPVFPPSALLILRHHSIHFFFLAGFFCQTFPSLSCLIVPPISYSFLFLHISCSSSFFCSSILPLYPLPVSHLPLSQFLLPCTTCMCLSVKFLKVSCRCETSYYFSL